MFDAGIGYYWVRFKNYNKPSAWTIGHFEGGTYPVSIIGSDEIYKEKYFSETILITTKDGPTKLC